MRTLMVAAGLLREAGKVLVTQRMERTHLELLWEFPGGKVTEGEEPRQALKRELREELGIETEIGRFFDATYYSYPEFSVLLLVYHARIREGALQPLACRALRWVDLEELGCLPMPPADEPIRRRLRDAAAKAGGLGTVVA